MKEIFKLSYIVILLFFALKRNFNVSKKENAIFLISGLALTYLLSQQAGLKEYLSAFIITAVLLLPFLLFKKINFDKYKLCLLIVGVMGIEFGVEFIVITLIFAKLFELLDSIMNLAKSKYAVKFYNMVLNLVKSETREITVEENEDEIQNINFSVCLSCSLLIMIALSSFGISLLKIVESYSS